MHGRLIVIDGADGAGKATQTKLLVERLQADGHTVETLDFPRYTENIFGKLIRESLDGKHGDFLKIDAKIASTLYAADRFESKGKIEMWLKEGKVVVLDRFVSSNMLHQGGKIADETERATFLSWLDTVEHEVFASPRPDKIFYLAVPAATRKILKEQALAEGKHGGEIDIAEADDVHQAAADAAAHTAEYVTNQKSANWQTISCGDTEGIRSREDIADEIYQEVLKILK